MVDEIEVDRADEIDGADEGEFLGLGEVAQVEETEFAEGDEYAGRAGILGLVEVPFWLGGAIGVWGGRDAWIEAMWSPSAVRTMVSRPGMEMVSPGWTMRRGLPSMALR